MITDRKLHTEVDLDRAGRKSLAAVFRMFDLWGITEKQKMVLLGMSKSTYFKAKGDPEGTRITPDLLERLSYLLNIHMAARTLFNNPENIYGFVRQPNNNGVFNGKSPLEYMGSGSVAALYEASRHMDGLRGGGW